jgi:hypothetical protein
MMGPCRDMHMRQPRRGSTLTELRVLLLHQRKLLVCS